jgi:hypothetical protein
MSCSCLALAPFTARRIRQLKSRGAQEILVTRAEEVSDNSVGKAPVSEFMPNGRQSCAFTAPWKLGLEVGAGKSRLQTEWCLVIPTTASASSIASATAVICFYPTTRSAWPPPPANQGPAWFSHCRASKRSSRLPARGPLPSPTSRPDLPQSTQ